ncbi:MAG: hypothetical protein J1E60_04535 [Christensenellaceae bacterium]|nr:hypothetical protein [Christensenellaceae bacterium]
MTIPMYYDYPMVTECTARVLETKQNGNSLIVRLDRSPLFPEGGGQLSDRGSIDDLSVSDVQIVNGDAWHYCSLGQNDGQAELIEVGSLVTVRLDVETRLDRAEQHTGEHILSGLASKLFSACNVGFHMAEDYCTIDLDTFLTGEQLDKLESAANAAVRANLPIHTEVVSGEEASRRSLRKHADNIEGDVRIVYIGGGRVDSCTCCGTHLSSTGMVGSVKITDSQRYKGGTRLWFACGNRAVAAAAAMQNAMTALARKFSTSREELPNAIAKQMNEITACKAEIKAKSALLAELYASKLIRESEPVKGIRPIVAQLNGLNSIDSKLIGDRICEMVPAVTLFFTFGTDGTNYRMACSNKSGMDMKQLCSAVNAAVNGKGGGSPMFAQGRTAEKVSEETIEMLKNYIISVLRG